MKLGRKSSTLDSRDLRLTHVLTDNLPMPPFARNWDKFCTIPPRVWGNDRYGDCAFAAQAGHLYTWTAAQGRPWLASTQQVLDAYSQTTGFDENDLTTDNGTQLRDALKNWQKNGIAGHKITAYASVFPTDHTNIKRAIDLFGGIYVGAGLPRNVEHNYGTWNTIDKSREAQFNSLGGHALTCATYDKFGVVFKTWGRFQAATWQWFDKYVDECWCVLGQDWVSENSSTPNGLDLNKLKIYLMRL